MPQLYKSISVPDAATYTVKRYNNGLTHYLPDLTADCAIALPAAEDGLEFTFVYKGLAADTSDWNISTGSDTNYYIGGLLYVDDAPAADSKNPDGNSNSIAQVLTPEPGTRVTVGCDGTHWIISGVVASANAPTFADQS